MQRQERKQKGITLVALVITIVILLILAGVSINLVLGPNGLITKAQEAALKTDKAALDEKIQMAIVAAQMENNEYKELTAENLGYALIKDGTKAIVSENEDGTIHILFLDEKKEYRLNSDGNIEDLNIDFDTKYVAPASQDEERNNGVIGIGTDGKPVDMVLWEYTLLDDGTYALNDPESVAPTGTRTAGYIGNIVDGRIEGTIPQYIKDKTKDSFIEVTNLESLFYNMSLIEAPKIPNTVRNMSRTFQYCSQLIDVSEIPNGVTNMYGTFAQCSSLEESSQIPITVTNMEKTFLDCISLKEAPIIPNRVINMEGCFQHCTKLISTPEIPNSVTNMKNTFRICSSLTRVTNIPNSVVDMEYTFYECTKLITVPDITENVENMHATFYDCSSLEKAPNILSKKLTNMQTTFSGCAKIITAPEIPESVENMHGTFQKCTALKTPPSKIPNSVLSLAFAFYNCENLQGSIEINANITEEKTFNDVVGYHNCFANNACSKGNGLKILKSSQTSKEMINNLVNGNQYIQIES